MSQDREASDDLVRVPCMVCGHSGDRPLLDKDGYHIVRCGRCGFVYLNPRPTAETMSRIYEQEYFGAGGTEGGYSDYLAQADLYRKTFAGRLRRVRRYKRHGKLLDVGCGPGFAMDAAASLGFEAWGIDLSEYATGLARERHGDRVVCGELEPGRFPSGSFDVITMFDLFEHIFEPREFLDLVAEILAPDGLVVITTPNHDSLLSRLSGAKWVSFKLPEHVAYYTPRSIKALLAGRFRVLRISSAGQHCSLGFLVERVRQLNRAAGGLLGGMVRIMRLERWGVYVNNGSMTLILRRAVE